MQESIQEEETRFRSDRMKLQKSILEFIIKSMGFSQSLSRVPVDGDTIPGNQMSADSG
jgi:hypothetical protein